MSKHDLQARPIYHHQRESIDAHLTIVFAPGHQPLDRRPHRLVGPQVRPHRPPLPHHRIQVGDHTITAADPLPDDLRSALDHVHDRPGAH
jgi:hypothetical protein